VEESLAALAPVVKMSDDDALWLFGELSPDEVVDRLLAIGATTAIVTLGASVLSDIGKFAVSCAAITVSRTGSNPPTMAEALA
jgi:sugar/nucleoside kinase (ribokinase family)